MGVGVALGMEGGRGEGESGQVGVHQLRAVQHFHCVWHASYGARTGGWAGWRLASAHTLT